jgi:hypothetical protein
MEEAKKLVEKIANFNNVDIEEVLPLLIQENGIDASINIADNKVVPSTVIAATRSSCPVPIRISTQKLIKGPLFFYTGFAILKL